ncbi:hypothetical protein L2750_09440 [Shewanella submarina]|uniref:Uncharacterized protein n=1 Tax=Shewanella submarina TaxID=2016376 RepID=A0ABV7G6V5_9GAMM|nr:hypothetical protein [Shewanella submarina]MCL1037377.1 hypothetical protein [Shewanella submarina]
MKSIIIAFALSLSIWPAYATDRITFPVPKFFKLHVISDTMQFNSVDMSITGFETNRSSEEIYEFYHRKWQGKIKTSHFGEWTIYSHLNEGLLLTVQFKKDSPLQISGMLALSNLPGLKQQDLANLGKGFPMPKNTKVANDIKADDGGRSTRSLLLINNNSVSSNLKFYKKKLVSDGWVIQPPATESGTIAGLLLNKENSTLNIMIASQDGETRIQVVRIDN